MVTVTTPTLPQDIGNLFCLCPHPSPCPINKKGTRKYRVRAGREGGAPGPGRCLCWGWVEG